jgi:hypothetical protein
MIAYICTCGYSGFADVGAEKLQEEEGVLKCARCGTPEKHFHGWGEAKMSTEEKIQEFINSVNLEKPREDSKDA